MSHIRAEAVESPPTRWALSLGVDSLSVPVNQLAAARKALTGCNAATLAEVNTEILRQRTTKEIRAMLQEWPKRD